MKRVAVIDDSQIVLDLVSHVLGQAGYSVTALEEPRREALLGEAPFDLVLVDVNMPQMLGDDLPSFFKDSWGIKAPILLFSDLAEEELAQRAKRAGADGFICKNWGAEALLEKVQALIGNPDA